MKKLTAEDFNSLKHSDRVYRIMNGESRKLFFVGVMPHSYNSYIFCEGTYLTSLHIDKDGHFSGDWYIGEYDSKFIGELLIKKHEDRIKSIKRIYCDE